jgi:formylmethanofuran dehydrogenase subunit E
MIEYAPNKFELSEEEQEIIEVLQEDMGLSSAEEVMEVLMRQAVQRIAITCPNCGHYARVTEEDKAICHSCLSVITLSEDVWEATHLPEE